jgi:isochorismatase family protein
LRKSFEYGTWGGEIRREFEPQPGEIVAQEHWGSGGFANTDLDLQLKKHGIHQLIVIGLIAHTCVEATVRYGAELVGADHRVEELVFRRGGPKKPSVVIATWAGHKKAGPLLISTEHRGTADGGQLQLFLSDISVKVTGSDGWMNAQ